VWAGYSGFIPHWTFWRPDSRRSPGGRNENSPAVHCRGRIAVDRVPQGRLNARMSYVSNPIHLVFSTKERRKLITPALRERLWPFMGGIARQNKMKAIEIGGIEDHVWD